MKASLRPGVSRDKAHRHRPRPHHRLHGRRGARLRHAAAGERHRDDLPRADPGARRRRRDSVGTEIAIQHLAATLPGSTVEITVKRRGRRRPPGHVRRVGARRARRDQQRQSRPLRCRRGEDHRAAQGQGRETRRARGIQGMSNLTASARAEVAMPMVADEPLILVDERNRPVGSAGKTAVHRQGFCIAPFRSSWSTRAGAFSCNGAARKKYHSGGLWANSCCGHPRPGERTLAAARRRLNEELGVSAAV